MFERNLRGLCTIAMVSAYACIALGSWSCSSRCAPGNTLRDGLCVRPAASSDQAAVGNDSSAGSTAAPALGGVAGATTAGSLSAQPASLTTGGVGAPNDPGSAAAAVSVGGAPSSPMTPAASQAPARSQAAPAAVDAGASAEPAPSEMAEAESSCGPTAETCDGADNDCDSRVDEDIQPMACGVDMGTCRPGTIECRSGVWENAETQCRGAVMPEPEDRCDGLDNDCDGTIDNGAAALCGTNSLCMGSSGCRECDKGFHKQGEQCVDVDECRTGNPCGPNADCRNTTGSHECQCRTGFEQQGAQCIAIDYCDPNPCDRNASCRSSGGRAQCSCNAGWNGAGTAGTCKLDYLSRCTQASDCPSDATCNTYCRRTCTGNLTSCSTGKSGTSGACLLGLCTPSCGSCTLSNPELTGAARYSCSRAGSCPSVAPNCQMPATETATAQNLAMFCGL